jgi:hypothetical protein
MPRRSWPSAPRPLKPAASPHQSGKDAHRKRWAFFSAIPNPHFLRVREPYTLMCFLGREFTRMNTNQIKSASLQGCISNLKQYCENRDPSLRFGILKKLRSGFQKSYGRDSERGIQKEAKNSSTVRCATSGWSVVKMWLAWGMITSFAPRIRAAMSSPLPGGTSWSESPWITRVGAVI